MGHNSILSTQPSVRCSAFNTTSPLSRQVMLTTWVRTQRGLNLLDLGGNQEEVDKDWFREIQSHDLIGDDGNRIGEDWREQT